MKNKKTYSFNDVKVVINGKEIKGIKPLIMNVKPDIDISRGMWISWMHNIKYNVN